MATHIINDEGNTVIACGADGSIARVSVEYPALLRKMRMVTLSIKDEVLREKTHTALMNEACVPLGLTRQSLLYCAGNASSIDFVGEPLPVEEKPAFKVFLESGNYYVTSMNENITLAEGIAYLWQCSPHVDEDEAGNETFDSIVAVKAIAIGQKEVRKMVDERYWEKLKNNLTETLEKTDKKEPIFIRFDGGLYAPPRWLNWTITLKSGEVIFYFPPQTPMLPRFVSPDLKEFFY